MSRAIHASTESESAPWRPSTTGGRRLACGSPAGARRQARGSLAGARRWARGSLTGARRRARGSTAGARRRARGSPAGARRRLLIFLYSPKIQFQQVSSICVVLIFSYSSARLEMLVFLLVCLLVLGWSI
jgi:hypothetical protein